MSTTFGVVVPSLYDTGDEEVEVARRSSNYVRWVNTLAPLLADDIQVVALDNTAQGIYTIGDIRKVINSDQKKFI
jgi:hypothetical protein